MGELFDARVAAGRAVASARVGSTPAGRAQLVLAQRELRQARQATRELGNRTKLGGLQPPGGDPWRKLELGFVKKLERETGRATRDVQAAGKVVTRASHLTNVAEHKALIARSASRATATEMRQLDFRGAKRQERRAESAAVIARRVERLRSTLVAPAGLRPFARPSAAVGRSHTVVPMARQAAASADQHVPDATLGLLRVLGQRFHLRLNPAMGNAQTTGGEHDPNSLHYQGRAIDFGDANNPRRNLMRLANYALAHPSQFTEMYYAPTGRHVKNGTVRPGEGAEHHWDHIHISI